MSTDLRKAAPAPADSPRPPRGYLRVGNRIALPVQRSSVVVVLCALAALLVAAVLTLTLGRLGIRLTDLPSAVFGGAEGKDAFVLNRLRGPRLVTGIATGAAFGLSGTLFQTVTRNPLGSPDIIGLSTGAGAGAAAFALLLPGVPVWIGAVLGAVGAMALVYVSTGTGFRNPGRLVVAGIGVAAISTAVIQYVVYVVERDAATSLTAYLNGSLAARSWSDATTIWVVLLATAPLCALVSRHLAVGEMGDEISASLGSDPGRTRTAAVVLSIVLAAGAVTVAGPIAFVALIAPQVARRITRGAGPRLLLSALTGALLLVLADLAAQQLPLFDDLPVGIYTMAVGGLYLGYLLTREWRRGSL
ncbi:iron ABC transporter permease [Streptomyces triticagri]|uniref:Iron ABC transporter permease n=1 Tax=Streptomyces triticagri TaxID=2293568 RepID=A0A372LZB5_9ACTN|nr:iron ABC transporter permease [Streptomyces triticagri]RFU84026.1 iron ABC transporter permease [Streptomyces triticagri]